MKKMDNKGCVDVVIPAYNAEKYIKECLNSALNQTYKNINIIVVNDGSTDCTEEILNEYKERITIINQKNSGPSRARNVGIQAGEGGFLAFLDSDDLWEPNYLERTVKFLNENEEIGYVFTEHDLFSSEGVIISNWIYADGRVAQIPVCRKSGDILIFQRRIWSDLAMGMGSFLPTSGTLFRKSVIKKVGFFDENLTNAEDLDLFIRIARKNDAAYISSVLHHKRHRQDSLCNDLKKDVIGSDVVAKRLLSSAYVGHDLHLQKRIKKRMSTKWYALGRLSLEKNNIIYANKSFVKSFLYYHSPRTLLFLFLSISRIYLPLKFLKTLFSKLNNNSIKND